MKALKRPAFLLALLLSLQSVACSKGGTLAPGSESEVSVPDGGVKAAEVDGRPIWVNEVGKLASETGKDPKEVLERMIDDVLLAAEARSKGYGLGVDVRDTRMRVLAFRLIDKTVVEPNEPGRIPDSEIQSVYQMKSEYHHPRARSVDHILVTFDGTKGTQAEKDALWKKAEDLAKRVAVDAKGTASEQGFLKLVNTYKTAAADAGLAIRSESIPDIRENDERLLKAFVDRAFEIPGPGKSGEPVKTPYGWHVIFIKDETPAVSTPLQQVRGEVASEVSAKRKTDAFNALMERLAKDYPYQINEPAFFGPQKPDAK